MKEPIEQRSNRPRVSLASLTHLRDFAGQNEGSAHWSFDEHTDRENRRRERERLKARRLLDLL